MSNIAVKWVMPYIKETTNTGDIPGVVVTVAGSIVIVGVKVICIYPTYTSHAMKFFDKWMNKSCSDYFLILSLFIAEVPDAMLVEEGSCGGTAAQENQK